MSLSQVRTYFQQRIAVVEPDLIEHQDAFNFANIPETQLDTRYHILYGSAASSNKIDNHVEDLFPITVTIWRRAFNSENETLDALMDVAHCIRMDAIDFENIETFGMDLLDVNATSITPSPIDDSNDNIIQVQIEFNVRLSFGFN